ncbi:hypothetical protein C8F04DRAFT_1177499 [Mycena alexandri]|uniref:Uncharacterized protein n=1 Tax=Mycena alexandri TaxID=1745969 RepID=A0AAD6T824_9AGAR|nr:hypothetical protein C8F04DRAFT_1177499 [Mycena alexandri]
MLALGSGSTEISWSSRPINPCCLSHRNTIFPKGDRGFDLGRLDLCGADQASIGFKLMEPTGCWVQGWCTNASDGLIRVRPLCRSRPRSAFLEPKVHQEGVAEGAMYRLKPVHCSDRALNGVAGEFKQCIRKRRGAGHLGALLVSRGLKREMDSTGRNEAGANAFQGGARHPKETPAVSFIESVPVVVPDHPKEDVIKQEARVHAVSGTSRRVLGGRIIAIGSSGRVDHGGDVTDHNDQVSVRGEQSKNRTKTQWQEGDCARELRRREVLQRVRSRWQVGVVANWRVDGGHAGDCSSGSAAKTGIKSEEEEERASAARSAVRASDDDDDILERITREGGTHDVWAQRFV